MANTGRMESEGAAVIRKLCLLFAQDHVFYPTVIGIVLVALAIACGTI